MSDTIRKLRAILPGTPDDVLDVVVDVVARDLDSRGGRPRVKTRPDSGQTSFGENLHETSAKPPASQLSGSDLRSGSSSGPSQSDLGISKLDGPTGLVFPVVGGGPPTWELGKASVAEWAAAFPGVDVMSECRKALAWVRAHERNRKTPVGMPQFLFKWMARAQDRGGRSPLPNQDTGRRPYHAPTPAISKPPAPWPAKEAK